MLTYTLYSAPEATELTCYYEVWLELAAQALVQSILANMETRP